jgi:branched-chain amino acid transport system substrate-binding protein
MRVGGKDVEGTFVVSGPAWWAEQLPDSHPSKKLAKDFVAEYEKAYGANSATSLPAMPTTPTSCWRRWCRWP